MQVEPIAVAIASVSANRAVATSSTLGGGEHEGQ